MNIIPDGSLQVGAMQRGQGGYTSESVVQQVPDVRVQSVDQGEAVVFPRIVLWGRANDKQRNTSGKS